MGILLIIAGILFLAFSHGKIYLIITGVISLLLGVFRIIKISRSDHKVISEKFEITDTDNTESEWKETSDGKTYVNDKGEYITRDEYGYWNYADDDDDTEQNGTENDN